MACLLIVDGEAVYIKNSIRAQSDLLLRISLKVNKLCVWSISDFYTYYPSTNSDILTLKAPITTAAEDKFCATFPNSQKWGMILHENRLPADDYHEISCLICYFLKSSKICNRRLLQIIGGALRVKQQLISTQIYTQKNDWKILNLFWLYNIWENNVQTKDYRKLIELPIYNSSKCKIIFFGSLVTIQYHTKCTYLLYPKFTSKKLRVYIFSATFTWSLLMF